MITTTTLGLVVSYVTFSTITTPASEGARGIRDCALVCMKHEACGGIVWDVGQVGHCVGCGAGGASCGMWGRWGIV